MPASAAVRPKLRAYCLPWHLRSSPAFADLLVAPLRPYADIELTAWSDDAPVDFSQPLIFCQIHPPTRLFADPRAHVVWLPMWDDARHIAPGYWATLPQKQLRVAAFSAGVQRQAERAGLAHLRLRFHKNPAEFPAADFRAGRVLFYWNRTGLVSREFLTRLCVELRLDRLIFRSATDPGSGATAYDLPDQIGATTVTQVDPFIPKADYDTLLRAANIYFAPRLYEGVGLTFLEAMSSGCAVLAHDTPTMNEYITHGRNGWLFPSICPPEWRERLHAGLHRRWPALVPPTGDATSLPVRQDWAGLRAANWAALGRVARDDQAAGYCRWLEQLPEFSRLILEW